MYKNYIHYRDLGNDPNPKISIHKLIIQTFAVVTKVPLMKVVL